MGTGLGVWPCWRALGDNPEAGGFCRRSCRVGPELWEETLGQCWLSLAAHTGRGKTIDMEERFGSVALDIIGKQGSPGKIREAQLEPKALVIFMRMTSFESEHL